MDEERIDINEDQYKKILDKYKHKLNTTIEEKEEVKDNNSQDFASEDKKVTSVEYEQFKNEYLPTHMSFYEKACNFSEKMLKIKPDAAREAELNEAIKICHLNITPTGATSLALLLPFVVMIFGGMLGYLIPNLLLNPEKPELFVALFFVFLGMVLYPILNKLPEFMANSWRLKASNQMVLCVFYIVTYMRHTSNLELAIEFASEHLSPPLSLDLKKILWNVETEKFESVKESLEDYLGSWKKWNMEFIESMHLIESSLFESSEERRLNALDKALSVMLEETYEKMLHYAHNLKSPMTMLHMLGIILPILGLVILPLVVSFMEGVQWYHIALIYNVALPLGVFYLGKMILSSRPTGYGASDISEDNPEMRKFKNIVIRFGKQDLLIPPLYLALIVGITLFTIGISPIIIHNLNPDFDVPLWGQNSEGQGGHWLIQYKPDKNDVTKSIGPFGLGAAILSFCVTLAFGVGLGLYFKLRSQNIIKIREEAKKLELEFASALFQLGNRLGDGLPAEIAFSKVAEVMEGSISGNFFNEVSIRITKLGMSVEQAIFDPQHGALTLYPSNLIESSMKVFTESAKKGPRIASNAIINVSNYIKEIHKVNERLKDLLADIISSMKGQISFLTPAISGIVIGITSMITTILLNLGDQFSKMSTDSAAGGAPAGMMTSMQFFGNGLPTFYFQIIVGLYVVQLGFILTILTNGIENGSDKLNERYLLGNNLIKSTVLFCTIALVITLIFNFVASSIMGSIVG